MNRIKRILLTIIMLAMSAPTASLFAGRRGGIGAGIAAGFLSSALFSTMHHRRSHHVSDLRYGINVNYDNIRRLQSNVEYLREEVDRLKRRVRDLEDKR